MVAMHQPWADALQAKYEFNDDNVTTILDREVGHVFARVLADAGVFKWNDTGLAAFDRFVTAVKNTSSN